MKKILRPFSKEEAVYYSDISGKCFDFHTPDVEVTVAFNYNSARDGDVFTLHFTDQEYKQLEEFLSKALLAETKKNINIK